MKLYFSTDATIGNSDDYEMLSFVESSPIAAGANKSYSKQVTFPSGYSAGVYYVGAYADKGEFISESNENNNSAGNQVSHEGGGSQPDLMVQGVYSSPNHGKAGDSFALHFTIKNQEAASTASQGSFDVKLYFSTDATIGNSGDYEMLSFVESSAIAAGASKSYSKTVKFPNGYSAGVYYVGAYADKGAFISESNENNNSTGNQITYEVDPANEIPLSPVAPTSQTAGSEFWLDIQVGANAQPVTDLFGISFELNYNNTNFIEYLSSEAGVFMGSDVIFVPTPDDPNGRVAIGVTRKSGAGGVNGNGTVARIKFKIIENTPNGTQIDFAINDVNATDPNGTTINLLPQSATITINSILVWPGDTNNDNLVNQADILPIGLYWHSTGFLRTDASMNWVGQPCSSWSPENATFADANGDGIVNQTDILPIGLNWHKTHTLFAAPNFQIPNHRLAKTNSATLKLNITGSTKQNGVCWIEFVADNVTDLFGISFEMEYSPTSFIDSIKAETESWFGDDIIFYPTIDMNNGKVSFGISRKAGQGGVSGTGVIAKLRIKLKDISPIETNLTLKNVYANDDQGNQIQFNVENYVITSIDDTDFNSIPSSYSLNQNYPNPFNPTTNINYELPKADHIKSEIFNLKGQKIKTLVNENKSAGVYNIFWDGKNDNGKRMVSGTYIYRITTSDFQQSKKMILLK